MDKFTVWKAVAVPLDQPNIDTNQLCPTRFNKVEKGERFARVLFHDLRFFPDGSERRDFILNQGPYRGAGILVAERNFGCGSSRESAVYAVKFFGVRAVIAPSFGDIFFNNCLKNSVVPVVLDADTCAELRAQLRANIGAAMTIDLEQQVVTDVDGRQHAFSIHPLRRRCLLEGLDDIALTTQFHNVIAPFEAEYRREFEWVGGK
ncbi:MAG TPA: 3-isopropylmalate dehydratase small subunit [Xanthobacteraceae bacterium]|jgi:3-isopropylmalate/(R)-2-methylmalate dehydratase small subunit|nr:3-isopropylmalate dehydratase small subunit [Xanthobacteraceae bacterium]